MPNRGIICARVGGLTEEYIQVEDQPHPCYSRREMELFTKRMAQDLKIFGWFTYFLQPEYRGTCLAICPKDPPEQLDQQIPVADEPEVDIDPGARFDTDFVPDDEDTLTDEELDVRSPSFGKHFPADASSDALVRIRTHWSSSSSVFRYPRCIHVPCH